jgi:hypothetical protein
MNIKDKIELLKSIKKDYKDGKIKIDTSKKHFGFKNSKILNNPSNKYIQGVPYKIENDGKDFCIKVIPIETCYNIHKNPSFIENILLKEFNNLLEDYNIPNLLYYIGSCKVDCKSKALDTKYFSNCQKTNIIKSVCNCLITEYVNKKSLDDYTSSKTLSLASWKSIIFQVLYTIYVLQKKYKLSHNDLHCGNILIDTIDKEGYLTYELNNQKYYVKHNGVIPKIFDFEVSESYNNSISKLYPNEHLKEQKKSIPQYFHPGYDVHYFLDSLLHCCIPEVEEWIRSKYHKDLLYNMDSSDNVSTTEKTASIQAESVGDSLSLETEDESEIPPIGEGCYTYRRRLIVGVENFVKLPTAEELMKDSFFDDFKKKSPNFDDTDKNNLTITFK